MFLKCLGFITHMALTIPKRERMNESNKKAAKSLMMIFAT